ncbi:hypothetical protein B296_00040013 [Ensete ventricosum]|uniref:Uncharacterized protein n=1 Tax=Ensete ventricosum TaxID=4639 RepID=A0A426XAS0_ENSVE|nr:hypothetical protein B296_00040013 [Ensete ventricosum]
MLSTTSSNGKRKKSVVISWPCKTSFTCENLWLQLRVWPSVTFISNLLQSLIRKMGLVTIREGKRGDSSGSDLGLEGYGRSYIPVFQIRMKRVKEVKRLPL